MDSSFQNRLFYVIFYKAAKGEIWAPSFISCAQDNPTAPTANRLCETFTFTYNKLQNKAESKGSS